MWYGDFGSGWWLVMSIGMVVFWSLVAYGVYLLLKGDRFSGGAGRHAEQPLTILKRRLASGEITIEEYERLRRMICGESSPKTSSAGPEGE